MAGDVATVDDYIASFPEDVRAILGRVRRTIQKAVPAGAEKISYGLPTITLDGRPVVHFAGWKHHISLYPVPAADEAFEREMAPYLAGKGTLKFPLKDPIPYDLIGRVASLLARRRLDGAD